MICLWLTFACANICFLGLQTPRLKRLAEIVSQQAIAQQEKLEFGSHGGDFDDHSMNDLTEVDEGPIPTSA